MTDSMARKRALAVLAALAGGLALAGCSATHVGESWQCPLAQGESCASVAAADPAVPGTGEAHEPVLREPLYRVRDAAGAPPAARRCEAECGGVGPLAWLARLFGGDDDDVSAAQDAGPTRTSAVELGAAAGEETGAVAPLTALAKPRANAAPPAREGPAVAPPGGGGPAGPSPAPAVAASEAETRDTAAPPTAALPALPALPEKDEGLRTGEVIGRIWVAPFVDAHGVYREASHVRVVLEPAGWRLP